jgi:hypothetical protein
MDIVGYNWIISLNLIGYRDTVSIYDGIYSHIYVCRDN